MAKLPTKPPRLITDTTKVASSNDNGAAEYDVSALCNSTKFIVAHPDIVPTESVNKLPEKLYLEKIPVKKSQSTMIMICNFDLTTSNCKKLTNNWRHFSHFVM